ncbi:uncharacterized protein K444DRAFT_610758 [Hyaloscypha bicolor E]|uniref:Pal1-domain-containing protein n=1 Tax=Hyaloscypha bicolor E TaxID=1095630 RepID=A0A2J6TI99_9HELO|nr:uncharacterized protein K444DRAFT_610758 [Hyaloscypha bicolor E]PMD62739.1 hypothetical protein K444DRAFT_610758 [Hyaloscypha bicolor E]
MFQSSRRPQPELPPACRPDDPRKESNWRPALRRIRRGIFSRKGTPQPAIISPNPSLLLNEVNQQRLNQRTWQSTEGGETRNPTYKHFRKESQTAPPPERRQTPRELNDSKGYNFFKRKLIKSKRHKKGSKEDVQPHQHKRRHTDLARPISTVYVPTRKSVEREPLLQRPSTAAYIPQHAAADFKRMSNYGPQLERYASLDEEIRSASLQPGHPVTVRPVAFEPDGESGDYQNFVAQSRAEAARTYESSGLRSPSKILPPHTAEIMGEIEASYHAAIPDRPRPTTSASKHVSGSGSFFEKVGEYYKPSESGVGMKETEGNQDATLRDQPVSVGRRASGRSTTSRPVSRSESFLRGVGEYIKPSNPDHHPGGANNSRTGPTGLPTSGDVERQATRWSMMSGASRRSLSQERDWERDRMAVRASWTSDSNFGRGTSSKIPTSPGLDRYNRGVRKGLYWR